MGSRRKIVVINREFQQHYALVAVAMAVLCTNLFIIARVMLPWWPPLEFTVGMSLTVAAVELVIIAVVWRGSIRASHRIAGPVYVITRQIKAVGAGDLTARISLRKKDMFKAQAADINSGLDDLQERVETVKALANCLQQAQSAGEDTTAHVDKLVEELATLQTTRES